MEVALTGRPNALNQAQSRKDSLSREQGWMRRGFKEKANNTRGPQNFQKSLHAQNFLWFQRWFIHR